MNTNIILIGPMRAGKTTIAPMLAERLNMTHISLDKVRQQYYAQIDHDRDRLKQLWQEGGYGAASPILKPLEITFVERVLQDYPTGTVMDFGGGHSVYEDEALFERARQALAPYPYVILLIPSDDIEECVQILHQRDLDDAESGLPDFNRHFIEHPSNRRLARFTVYTKGKTVEQTRDEILALVTTISDKA